MHRAWSICLIAYKLYSILIHALYYLGGDAALPTAYHLKSNITHWAPLGTIRPLKAFINKQSFPSLSTPVQQKSTAFSLADINSVSEPTTVSSTEVCFPARVMPIVFVLLLSKRNRGMPAWNIIYHRGMESRIHSITEICDNRGPDVTVDGRRSYKSRWICMESLGVGSDRWPVSVVDGA